MVEQLDETEDGPRAWEGARTRAWPAAAHDVARSGRSPTGRLGSYALVLGSEPDRLVVDNEVGVRTLVRVLEEMGHSVREANTGPEALDLVGGEALEPAFLITDVVMPEMSGVELGPQLAERLPGVKSIFLSGYSERKEIDEIQHSNAPFLSKPFTPGELVIAVEKVLQSPA